MGTLLRLLLSGALVYGFAQAWRNADANRQSGDLANAFWMAFCVVVGIAAAIAWAPLVAGRVADPLTSPFTGGHAYDHTNRLMGWITWADGRGHRRLTRWLCFVEGVRHPDLPTQFIVGLRNARPGSWLERAYAREVYRFNNVENCEKALAVLRRHGIEPPPHRQPGINLALRSADRAAAPERPTMAVPEAPEVAVKRNPRIRLFDDGAAASGDGANRGPSATPDDGHV